MLSPRPWISLHEYGIKIYGIVTAVDAGNATIITSQGVYSRPYSNLTPEPLYINEELRLRLLADYQQKRLIIRDDHQ